jgi:hypothetical protein
MDVMFGPEKVHGATPQPQKIAKAAKIEPTANLSVPKHRCFPDRHPQAARTQRFMKVRPAPIAREAKQVGNLAIFAAISD